MDTVPPVAQGWIDALARRDFDALGAALDPGVHFRALVPGELVTVAEAVACSIPEECPRGTRPVEM